MHYDHMCWPKPYEVRAVYVSPAAGRQGIGKQLLERLELFAQENGLKELWLDASLNAAKFYTANGFTVDAPGEHTLSSGRKMACIKMRKIL
jgi:N-acetylglutamate synthase-like GNAT family acetyltransferase